MILYSMALLLVLALSSPVWGWRMLRQGRYRQGFQERLGGVPHRLLYFVQGRPVIWVHAVSVGETVAAERLLRELEAALPGHAVVLSTTTPTGQQVARERFGADRVFYYPLDFAFAVRAYLHVLKPSLLVLMESELWPRMLHECARAGIPVAVANARVSDRSLPRYLALRRLWEPLLRRVTLLLAQSPQDAERWGSIGIAGDRIVTAGNLKYDIAARADSPLAQLVRAHLPVAARVLVAGSTHEGEETVLLDAFAAATAAQTQPALLVLAPRHPERSEAVLQMILRAGLKPVPLSRWRMLPNTLESRQVLLVDTVGELASLYSLAAGSFLGGSLISRGGHNPLEAAQFGAPVAMGPHFENFRSMVETMRTEGAITILQSDDLSSWFQQCLSGDPQTQSTGERARSFYTSQQGATERTVEALVSLVRGERR